MFGFGFLLKKEKRFFAPRVAERERERERKERERERERERETETERERRERIPQRARIRFMCWRQRRLKIQEENWSPLF